MARAAAAARRAAPSAAARAGVQRVIVGGSHECPDLHDHKRRLCREPREHLGKRRGGVGRRAGRHAWRWRKGDARRVPRRSRPSAGPAHAVGIGTPTAKDGTATPRDNPRDTMARSPCMATLAIGDIHGNLKPLCDLLERVRPDVGAGDTVVFLGDYIDRGRDTGAAWTPSSSSRPTCRRDGRVPAGQPRGVVPARDARLFPACVAARHGSRRHDAQLLVRGGRGDPRRPPGRRRGDLYEGRCTLPYELFFDAMPAAHRRFFETLGLFHEHAECVCTHAGMDPRGPRA